MSDKYGYIPIYNYIIKIKIFDNIEDVYSGLKKDFDNCRYLTSHFEIIQIIDYLTDTEICEIKYIISGAYLIYGSYQDNLTPSSINESYQKNNLYTEKRFYYKTSDRALSDTFMKYKLYQKYQNGCSGDYISYYPSGTLREKYYHINGLKEGIYKKYFESGSLEEEIEYVNGLKHGCSKKYNGSIDIIEYYSMDKLDGLCIYNNLGRLSAEYKVEITYKNGIIDGLYRKYYKYKDGGKLYIECNFKDGKYYGIYKEYDENGNLVMECDYKTYNKKIDIKDLM